MIKNEKIRQKRQKNNVASRGSRMLANNRKAGITFTVYMRLEGRVTVPKELRDAYDLREGDLVECSIKKIK